MLLNNAASALTRFNLLLDEEREVILAGSVAKVADLAQRKESLLQSIRAMPLTAAEAGELRDKATRNSALLNAAMQGIRAVISRVEILRSGGPGLNTYDRAGQRQSLSAGRACTFEKKA